MSRWQRMITFARLLRLEQAVAAVSNSWLMVFLAFGLESESHATGLMRHGLGWALALGGLASGGLAIYAMALNDVLDLRHDRTFQPHRPLASGRVSPAGAWMLALGALVTAMVAATMLGLASAVVALTAAVGILFYNTAGKHLPAVGIVTLGLIWALNMLIVHPWAAFIWPVWLNMSHVMFAVWVLHALQGKRPRLRMIDMAGIAAGWLFWTLALLAVTGLRETQAIDDLAWIWVGPAIGVVVYLMWSWRIFAARQQGTLSRSQTAMRYGMAALLSLMLFDAGWLVAMGLYGPMALLLGLMVIAAAYQRLMHFLERLEATTPRYRVSTDNHDDTPLDNE